MTATQSKNTPEFTPLGFDDLQLQVGSRLQLALTRDLKQIQLFSGVIGWLKNEYLLLQIPHDGTQPFPLREGDRLTLRVFSGVQVCWFHSSVLRILQPYLYMHVAFPREIFGRQLRTAPRVRVNIPAEVTAGAGAGFAATLRNLSVSGASLETAEHVPDAVETLGLSFALQTPDGVPAMRIQTKAVIRNRTSGATADSAAPFVYTYGLQFTELDATQKLALQNLVYETLITDRQKLV